MFATVSKRVPRSAIKALTALFLMMGLVAVSAIGLPAGKAGAATDSVTNCSGSPSVAGSLPYEVQNAAWGDAITFALAPTCNLITVAHPISINESLSVQGPGADLLAVSGGGSSQIFNIAAGPYAVAISGLTIENGNGTPGAGGFPGNGGAIANQDSLTVADDAFVGNTTYDYGGAIANEGTLTVQSSSFVGNSSMASAAGYGAGAIYNDSTASVADSTLAGNSATDYGGAVLNFGTIGISNSTIADNTATNGGGVFTGSVDQVTLAASVMAGNTASFGGDCYGFGSGTLIDNGYNLDDGNSCQLSGPGDVSGTPAGLDPSGPQNNGGPTQTIAPNAGSPAIGLVTDPSLCPATDQRGAARPTSGSCDAGAYDTNGTSFNPSVSSVTITGGLDSPMVTVTGSGFGNQSDLGAPAAATSCSNSNTGSDYNNFSFSDVTTGWGAGGGSNCIGVSITSYSDTQFTFTFGNGYGNGAVPNEYGALEYGDSFQVNMLGATYNGAVPPYSPTPTISSVAITGNLAAPTVTVSGSGFGALADLGLPVPAYCGNTGSDYGNNFYLTDGWGAGQGVGPFGDCTGVSISSYSNTQITFTFGTGYGTGANQYGVLSYADSFQMNVLGATYNGTVPYPATPTIHGVTFGGDPTNPTVTVSGSGFGTQSDLGTPVPATSCSNADTGSDYGNTFYFADPTGSWQAGQAGNFVGLVISSYSNTQITFTFGNQYSVFGPVNNGDSFSVTLFGVTFNGTASLGDRLHLHCLRARRHHQLPGGGLRVPGPTGQHRRRGDLPDRPGAQVTIPASVLNHFIGHGGHLPHHRLPDHRPRRADLGRRGPERCGQSQHRVGLGLQPAPERHPGGRHPLHLRHHLQPGHLADRAGDRQGRLHPREHRRRGHLRDPRDGHPRVDQLHPPHRGGRPRLHHGQPAAAHPHLPGARLHPAPPEPGQCRNRRGLGGDHRQHLDGHGHRAHRQRDA